MRPIEYHWVNWPPGLVGGEGHGVTVHVGMRHIGLGVVLMVEGDQDVAHSFNLGLAGDSFGTFLFWNGTFGA